MRVTRVLGLGVVVALGGAGAALAAAGPSGNKQAISIARMEARAYTKIPVETYTETGYIEMTDQEGKTSYFSFAWGQTRLTPGWAWATEHATAALKNGHVVWWRDDLTPPSCTAAGICHEIPVEIVVEHGGGYYAFGNAANHTCFGRLTGSQPVSVGQTWSRVFGHFSAPVFGKGTVALTYTYPWGTGKTARETDTLATRTHLQLSGRTLIAGKHTVIFTTNHPKKAPKAPKVNLCSG